MSPQFVVVRKQSPYTFHQFHPTVDSAQKEAERLCRKERVPLLVLAVVGEIKPVEVPVQWEFAEGFDPRGEQ